MNYKILFFGTPRFSKEILSHLIKNGISIHTVITQPDKPVGRKQILTKSPVKKYARKNELPLKQFSTLDQIAIDFFRQLSPDLIIVVAYGIILPTELINLPKFGCINIHPSLLPKYRGASPIQTAILNGEKETGVTIILMDEKMDTGDIITQKKITLNQGISFLKLEKKLIKVTQKMIIPTIKKWIRKEITPQPQDPTLASYTKIINKKDGLINWNNSAKKIFNQYLAFSFWPEVFTTWRGKKIILKEINLQTINKEPPGKIYQNKNGDVLVGTSNGAIELRTIQLEGKRPLLIKEFVNGQNDFIGEKLLSHFN